MTKDEALTAIKIALKGIDVDECASDDGWWETSEGAEHGKRSLNEVLKIVASIEQPAQEPLTSLDEIFADEIFRLNRDIVPLPEHLIHEIAQRNYHPELGINPVAFTAAIEKAHGIGGNDD